MPFAKQAATADLDVFQADPFVYPLACRTAWFTDKDPKFRKYFGCFLPRMPSTIEFLIFGRCCLTSMKATATDLPRSYFQLLAFPVCVFVRYAQMSKYLSNQA